MVKRFLAKEGLVLLGIVIFGLAVYFIGRYLNNIYLIEHQDAKYKVIHNMKYSLLGYTPYLKVMSLGLYIAIFGYPVVAFIRYIAWSVKTLKHK